MSGWQPATEAEESLLTAATAGDKGTFLSALSNAPLLLPVSPEAAAGREPARWATGESEGVTYVFAFTSPATIAACLPGQETRYLVTTVAELATDWPDPAWWLAVNPGTPIGARLDARILCAAPAPDGVVTAGEAALLEAVNREDSDAYMAALARSSSVTVRRSNAQT